MPVMFFRKRVVPKTPPSLVMSASAASDERIGMGASTPMSDQVPELRYANRSVEAGTAATAEAVSCPATDTTGICARPQAFAISGFSKPATVPGWTSGAKRSAGTVGKAC